MTMQEIIDGYTLVLKESCKANGLNYTGRLAALGNAIVSMFAEVHLKELSKMKSQAFLDTADEEHAIKHLGNLIKRMPPSYATGRVMFFGLVGAKIESGTEIRNELGISYATQSPAEIKKVIYAEKIISGDDTKIVLENTNTLPDFTCDIEWKPTSQYILTTNLYYISGDGGLVFFDTNMDEPINLVARDLANNIAGSKVTALIPNSCLVNPSAEATYDERELTVIRLENYGTIHVIVLEKPDDVLPNIEDSPEENTTCSNAILKWIRGLDRSAEGVSVVSSTDTDGTPILYFTEDDIAYFHEMKDLESITFAIKTSGSVNVMCNEFGADGNVAFNGYMQTIQQITGIDTIAKVAGTGITGGFEESLEEYKARGLEIMRNPYSGFSVYQIKKFITDQMSNIKYVWVKGADDVDVPKFFVYIYALNYSFSLSNEEEENIKTTILAIKPSDMGESFIEVKRPKIIPLTIKMVSIAPYTEDLIQEVKNNLISFFNNTDTFEKGIRKEDVYFVIKSSKIVGGIYPSSIITLQLLYTNDAGSEVEHDGSDEKGLFWKFGKLIIGEREI